MNKRKKKDEVDAPDYDAPTTGRSTVRRNMKNQDHLAEERIEKVALTWTWWRKQRTSVRSDIRRSERVVAVITRLARSELEGACSFRRPPSMRIHACVLHVNRW